MIKVKKIKAILATISSVAILATSSFAALFGTVAAADAENLAGIVSYTNI